MRQRFFTNCRCRQSITTHKLWHCKLNMKFLAFLCILCFSSCGIVTTIKRDNFITSKGYDPGKDTSIIKPYEYYIKHKGFVPIYRELNAPNKLDLKIGILGFENSDTIPIGKLFETMTYVLSDNSYTVENGELVFSRNALSHILRLGRQNSDTCLCKASFNFIKTKSKAYRNRDILFFWNVTVSKNGTSYVIPSRTYFLKWLPATLGFMQVGQDQETSANCKSRFQFGQDKPACRQAGNFQL